MGITSTSILSDENIEISLEPCYSCEFDWEIFNENMPNHKNTYFYYGASYNIVIKNKTNNLIYVDTGYSFRISPKGDAEPFYNGISVINSNGGNKGGGLNAGAVTSALGIGGLVGTIANGVNIGGASTYSSSITESQERILVIPPQGNVFMPQKVYLNQNKTKSTRRYEVFDISYVRKHSKIEKWAYTPLNEDYIDFASKIVITYSKQQDFNFYTSLTFGVFPRGLFGDYGLSDIIQTEKPVMYGGSIEINRKD